MNENTSKRVKMPLEIHCTLVKKAEEEDWEEEVRKIVETSLYYFVKCPHCEIVFFVEEAVDRGHHYGISKNPFFRLKCPMCETHFQLASINRLKLSLEKVVEESELFLLQTVVNKEEPKT